MALGLKAGTVTDTTDFTRTGLFWVRFDINGAAEPVKYVSPYATNTAAFVSIPKEGSQVLALYQDEVVGHPEFEGNYYVGSVVSDQPGLNSDVPFGEGDMETENKKSPAQKAYTPSDKKGLNSPALLAKNDKVGTWLLNTFFAKKSAGSLPLSFGGMYEAQAVLPQQLGMTTEGGDGLVFSNRKNSVENSENPFQDYKVSLKSGKGKRLELVDSPIINGLTYQNENTGLDYLVWCSKGNPQSPFSKGEFHMRTHGPVNLYTLWSSFHIWVQNGKNIDIENKSGDSLAFNIAKFPRKSDGRTDSKGNPMSGLGDPGNGAYSKTREGKFGNQSTGCVNITSHRNDVVVKALNPDSIVHVYAPGVHSKVIIEAGGSVDIVAKGKITLQSETEVEINAPLVDINGKASGISEESKVDIHAGRINLNDPDHSWDGY